MAFIGIGMLAMTCYSTIGDSNPALASVLDECRIGVIVSLKIKPYMDAVKGIDSTFESHDNIKWDVLFLDPNEDLCQSLLIEKIADKNYNLLLAVGPEAMRLIWGAFPGETPLKLFSMVMNPKQELLQNKPFCGVPLDIPADIQLGEFNRYLPSFTRIGLIYDPRNNTDFANAASIAASRRGIEMVHLKIDDRRQILPEFRRLRMKIDALWMIPDATVISESIIPFIIKEAIANNVAVFGYNRFFHENGALISLVRDYEAIGKHSARMVLSVLGGGSCQLDVPDYEVMQNPEVLDAIGYPKAHDQQRPNTEERK